MDTLLGVVSSILSNPMKGIPMLGLPPKREGTHFMGTLFMIAKIRDAQFVQSYGAHNVSDPIFFA